MKKIINIVVAFVLVFCLVTANVSAYSNTDFLTTTQEIINKYGVFEQSTGSGEIYAGLIYGEFIDFDSNGVEELLLVYTGTNQWDDPEPGWATVVVYSVVSGKLSEVFRVPVDARIMQTDISYAIRFLRNNGQTFLVVNTLPPDTTAAYNEKILVFTMDGDTTVYDTYYGETLDWWETGFELKYTKCMINDKLVSVEKYVSTLDWIDANSKCLYLIANSNDYNDEEFTYISYNKIIEFLNVLDKKVINEVKVNINGEKIDFEVLPQVIDGRTLVPMRTIFEMLNTTVEWDNETQKITAYNDDITIVMTVGKNEMYINGKMIWLDVAPAIISSRTLVPVRAIAEAFNCNVEWDANNNTVIINY